MSRHQLKPQPTAAERMERKRKAKEQPKVDYYLAQKAKALSYNYAEIPEEHRELVQRAALDIRSRLKRTVEDMIEIGRQLNEVRGVLIDDGKYHGWLKAEFGMSVGSASEYRSIAARFGGEVSIIETLSPTIVRRLAAPSVPIEAIEAVRVAAQTHGKPLKVREAMAIIRPFRTPKLMKPNQLPGPVAEPEPEAQVIDAEYTIIQQDSDQITLSLTRSLVRKLQAGALRNQRFWDMFTGDELDRLNIIFSKALKDRNE